MPRAAHDDRAVDASASAGGWLIDTPGMRNSLADAAGGIDEVFADIVALAHTCRSLTARINPSGMPVITAIEDGTLDPVRLERYRKLQREDARNSEAIWQRRARSRAFGKMAKDIIAAKRSRREE